jgi:23S rRNA pseudouridine2605 synthase
MEERLQKIMAAAGIGSRRACEEIIAAGRVTVNGKVALLGQKADLATDRILVDGQPIKPGQALIYIALNKPRGVVSTADEEFGRPTVLDLVPVDARIYPVGRLDMDSEGLVLLTNDGDLSNQLTHPKFGHTKEYRVLVARHPDQEQFEAWRHGVVLEDGYRTAPAEVSIESTYGKGAWLRVVLTEGRKRQIREMGAQTGLPIVRIVRVRIGTLQLGSLKAKQWRYLTAAEIASLKKKAEKKPVEKTRQVPEKRKVFAPPRQSPFPRKGKKK